MLIKVSFLIEKVYKVDYIKIILQGKNIVIHLYFKEIANY